MITIRMVLLWYFLILFIVWKEVIYSDVLQYATKKDGRKVPSFALKMFQLQNTFRYFQNVNLLMTRWYQKQYQKNFLNRGLKVFESGIILESGIIFWFWDPCFTPQSSPTQPWLWNMNSRARKYKKKIGAILFVVLRILLLRGRNNAFVGAIFLFGYCAVFWKLRPRNINF